MISPGMRYNAENVRYHATSWMTGDGSTSSGTLLDRHGNPISSGKLKRVDSIHRTDWQGRQLLYATARTNAVINSILAGGSSSAAPTGWTIGASGTSAPVASTLGNADGAVAYQQTAAAQRPFISRNCTVVTGSTYVLSVYVEVVSGGLTNAFILAVNGIAPTGFMLNGVAVSGSAVAAPGRLEATFVANSTAMSVRVGIGGSGSATGGLTFSRPQLSATPGAYIPTTTAAVTVTDYTLTGPSVALGQVPVVGAVLDWDGVAKR